MKKICITNLQMYSLFNQKSDASIGGAEVQLYALAHYFVQTGFNVDVVTGDWGQPVVEFYDKIRILRSVLIKKKAIAYIRAPFLLWFSLQKSDADVYITSNAGVETGIVAFFCWLYHKKMIYRTSHDMDCDGTFVNNNFIIGRIYKYGLKHADKVITQNTKNKKQLKEVFDIDAQVIRNVWDINSVEIKKEKFILWVARCTQWKNPHILLELAVQMPTKKFVMVCPMKKGEEQLFNQIKDSANALENVTFIDFVPFDDIQQYFGEAHVFINTSKYEGFPNTFIQACIGSTPIISYKVNPDDVLIDENIGCFASGDKTVLLNMLKNSFKNKSGWEKKSQNCYQYVKKYHDIEKNGRIWEKEISLLIK